MILETTHLHKYVQIYIGFIFWALLAWHACFPINSYFKSLNVRQYARNAMNITYLVCHSIGHLSSKTHFYKEMKSLVQFMNCFLIGTPKVGCHRTGWATNLTSSPQRRNTLKSQSALSVADRRTYRHMEKRSNVNGLAFISTNGDGFELRLGFQNLSLH